MIANLRSLRQRVTAKMNPPVFFGSAALVIGFCVFGGIWTETASSSFNSLQQAVSQTLGWYYMLMTTLFLLFAFWLMFSRYGHIRLGPPDSRPEFGYLSWFAMLFSAGMGTGIVFWGVAEPLHHYMQPPVGEGGVAQAAETAMRYTFFHWGLHPWAIYIILGVALAYFHFRHDLPLAPRAVLYPLIGDRMNGAIGHCVDILCTVGTLLGVSTSLGLGAMQVNAGMAQFMDMPQGTDTQVTIIAIITAVATLSVVSGIQAGIRRLSTLNLGLSALLLLFVFVVGPTLYMMETFVGSLGLYIQHLPEMSLWVDFAHDTDWQASWTFFYWGWWISWSPFVGIFVARVSRGRTIREFVFWVMVLPVLGTFFWLSVFGGSAIHSVLFEDSGLAGRVMENVGLSLHALLALLPLADVSMTLATLVVIIFFITSSDSGSLVDDMVTSGGHPHPPKPQRVFWAVSEGSVAATLLMVGGLRAIQDASISMGSLMSLVLVAACIGLIRAFREWETPEGPVRSGTPNWLATLRRRLG